MKTTLPTERTVFQFEKAHACVIFTCDKDFNGTPRPKLYIQAIDQYRYQRELSIEYRHEPGDSSKLFWECHAYRHPGRRHITQLSPAVAKRLIARILHLSAEYPSLLFNAQDNAADVHDRPRSEGFVHFHETLLDGAEPSVKLLD